MPDQPQPFVHEDAQRILAQVADLRTEMQAGFRDVRELVEGNHARRIRGILPQLDDLEEWRKGMPSAKQWEEWELWREKLDRVLVPIFYIATIAFGALIVLAVGFAWRSFVGGP